MTTITGPLITGPASTEPAFARTPVRGTHITLATVRTIAGKEFRSYFQSPIAYIFITAFLVLTHFFFFRSFFVVNQATMREFFSLIPVVFLFFVPALTMRLWAEERKLGTTELLLTFPVEDWEAVLGKFAAAMGFLAVALGCTLPLTLTVILLGRPDGGAIVGGYLGALLLGGTYMAVGLWLSSLTSNQIVAFILALFGCFALFMIGEPIVLSAIPQALGLRSFCAYLSVGYHFDSMGRGVVDLRDLLYYVSVIAFFLFLNVRSIESRKWS
jgi:ABC-2 type transport system permease protein